MISNFWKFILKIQNYSFSATRQVCPYVVLSIEKFGQYRLLTLTFNAHISFNICFSAFSSACFHIFFAPASNDFLRVAIRILCRACLFACTLPNKFIFLVFQRHLAAIKNAIIRLLIKID